LAGTPDAIDFADAVVFLEDVNEPLYRRDRLLTQIRASGMFRGVKALISGNLHDCEPAQVESWKRLLLESVPESVPVVTDLSFGHGPGNLAFPIGARVALDTHVGQVVWRD
jgi:muramoyltetrapeptide carboxypeptidase